MQTSRRNEAVLAAVDQPVGGPYSLVAVVAVDTLADQLVEQAVVGTVRAGVVAPVPGRLYGSDQYSGLNELGNRSIGRFKRAEDEQDDRL
jgi:hypothetical protein